MAGFEDDPLVPGCYSELLCADEIPGFETGGSCFDFSGCKNFPRMLCFGDYANVEVVVDNSTKTGQRSGPACTGSFPVHSTNKTKVSTLPASNKKRDGSGNEWNPNPGVNAGAPTGSQRRNGKKLKSDNSTITGGHAKVSKKEKLGERIAALQQLVSPFGKTDTASVLHEAFGYIKFLQDQVKVLSSPYLQRLPLSSASLHSHGNGEIKEIERRTDDLGSRGLCVVPVELTLRVADSSGADLWSSAAMLNNVSSNL